MYSATVWGIESYGVLVTPGHDGVPIHLIFPPDHLYMRNIYISQPSLFCDCVEVYGGSIVVEGREKREY